MNTTRTAPRCAGYARRRAALLLWLLPASLLLGACGFHLRGNITLPEEMKSLALQGTPAHSELANTVRNSVVNAGGELVSDASLATALLVISQDGYQRRVLSVNNLGQANAYELDYQLVFQLTDPRGEVRVATQQIKLQRQYRFDPGKVLAKSDEEQRIVSEMRRSATRQMLRRLVAGVSAPMPNAKPTKNAPSNAPAP